MSLHNSNGEKYNYLRPTESNEWQQLLDDPDELDDIRLYDEVKARNEPTVLLAEYRRQRLRNIYG